MIIFYLLIVKMKIIDFFISEEISNYIKFYLFIIYIYTYIYTIINVLNLIYFIYKKIPIWKNNTFDNNNLFKKKVIKKKKFIFIYNKKIKKII